MGFLVILIILVQKSRLNASVWYFNTMEPQVKKIKHSHPDSTDNSMMSSHQDELLNNLSHAKVLLLDIEGTTTPITFVHDVLFPYIRTHLSEYLSKHWEEPECQQDVEALRQQAKLDCETVPTSGTAKDIKQSVIDSVNWLMDADRKVTALKQLQGHMWLGGYREGVLMGEVYDDVVPILEQWKRTRKDICIYSSGSVAAQKLLFGYSTYGDLLYLLSNHFDTKIGMKIECDSYHNIAEELQYEPQDILFLTDVVREARPAREAGLSVAIVIRPGNAPITEEEAAEFPTIRSFTELQPQNSFKR